MTLPETYDYLIRARRDLWAALEAAPNEVLSRPLLPGERFHCVKDLLFHISAVEDSWLHEDILREPSVFEATPALAGTQGGPEYAGFPLSVLLEYHQAVEARTLAYLAALVDAERQRVVTLHDAPERFAVDGLLWHVLLHEVRHTAQVALLLRLQGIRPPSLDLLFYLPNA